MITHVNGAKQKKPIIFRREVVTRCDFFLARELQFDEGDHWELRAFEKGAFAGCPEEAFREIAKGTMGGSYNELDVAFPSRSGRFGYRNELQYISGRKAKLAGEKSATGAGGTDSSAIGVR